VEAVAVVERAMPHEHARNVHERVQRAGGEAPDGVAQLA
jgi:hypothetical protein